MFRDSLLRRQIGLSQLERGTQVELMKLLDDTERALRVELQDRLGGLAGKAFGPTTNSRLNVLTNSIRKIRESGFSEVADMWDSTLQQLAVDEAAFVDEAFKKAMPVTVDTVLPDDELLRSLADTLPVRGRVLSEWASTMAEGDVRRIMDNVRIGMVQGDDADSIVRRILGTKALDGADGVLQMARHDVASVTQTAISSIADAARGEYFEENSDVFDMEAFTATLDDTTCEECGSLDGRQYKINQGPRPPIHFNCRCVRVPVIGNKLIGNRPANAATEDLLSGLKAKDRAAKIAELVGPVPASTTYADWLRSQSTAFQDHVLGPSRSALFRDGGLPLDKFVAKGGRHLNLDQLRALEPSAFKTAGV